MVFEKAYDKFLTETLNGRNFLWKKLELYTTTSKQPNLSSDPDSPLLGRFRSQAFPKAGQGYGPQLLNNGILCYLTSKGV